MDSAETKFLTDAILQVARGLNPETSLIGIKLEDVQVDTILDEIKRVVAVVVISQGRPDLPLTKQAKAELVRMSKLDDR